MLYTLLVLTPDVQVTAWQLELTGEERERLQLLVDGRNRSLSGPLWRLEPLRELSVESLWRVTENFGLDILIL